MLNNLKIKQAVLIAVKKVSGAAFNKKLGNHDINFSCSGAISVLSMYAAINGEHIECFSDSMMPNGLAFSWQTSFPDSVKDIPRFQSDVEKGLAEIFKYVEANNNE